MRWLAMPTVFVLVLASALAADPNAEAERLYREAQVLVEQAERTTDPAEASRGLNEAKAKLDSIPDRFPASRRASQMVLGDPLLTRLERSLAKLIGKRDAAEKSCLAAPTRACVLDLALTSAQQIVDTWNRKEVFHAIAVARAKAGHFEVALATAKEIADAKQRAGTLREIAVAQARAGQIDAALATAKEVADARQRDLALHEIAVAQARAGQVDAALATAREIADVGMRAEVLYDSALTQPKVGQVEAFRQILEALRVPAREIVDARNRALAFRHVAVAQARAGHFEAALATAKEIADAKQRAWTLREIAVAQARAGQINAALATAREIGDRGGVLREIAEAQAKAGQIEAALATAREIADAKEHAIALGAIYQAQAEVGQVEAARQTFQTALVTAREIADTWKRIEVFRDIALAQAKAGQADAALASAREIADLDQRALALFEIALAQVDAGQFEIAVATTREFTDTGDRANPLRLIALAQAKAGQFEAARTNLASALATAREIADAEARAWIFREIAEVQAVAGQLEAARASFAVALATTREIADAGRRNRALQEIAESQAKSGEVAAALTSAREIVAVERRMMALAAIAGTLPSPDEYGQAVDLSLVSAALDELSGALRWKAARDLEAIGGAFYSVYDIDRARWWADVLGAPLAGLRASLAWSGAASRLGQAGSRAALAQPGAFLSLGADLLHVRSLVAAGGDLGQALSGPAYADAIAAMYEAAGKAGDAQFAATIRRHVTGEEGPGLLAIVPPVAARERGLRTLVTRTATVQEAVDRAGRELVERLARARPGTVKPEEVTAVAEELRSLAGAVKRSAVENIRVPAGDGGEGVWLGAVAAQHGAHTELLQVYAAELGQKQVSVVVGLVASATTAGLQVLNLQIGAVPTSIQTTVKDVAALGHGATSWTLSLSTRELVAELPQQMVWTLASELEAAWELVEAAMARAERRLTTAVAAQHGR